MILQKLRSAGTIQAPRWLVDQTQYLTIMGSDAYGVSGATSDLDIYGFCVPPKDLVFPHTAGEILGFGRQIQRFDQWQQHHIPHPDRKDTTYDFQVFGIVKYFQLCMECNPNMIDSLFTPRRCVLHSTPIGEIVRENRKLFLHKGSYHKFRGYAYSQLSKIKNKVNSSNPQRAETIERFGYDVKFAYHLIRLLDEAEQILTTHDLNIEQNREQLKAIRRGEWTLEQIEEHFTAKERTLESLYVTSTLRHSPDEAAIKEVLLHCLEMHYGSLDKMVSRDQSIDRLVRDMQEVLDRYGTREIDSEQENGKTATVLNTERVLFETQHHPGVVA